MTTIPLSPSCASGRLARDWREGALVSPDLNFGCVSDGGDEVEDGGDHVLPGLRLSQGGSGKVGKPVAVDDNNLRGPAHHVHIHVRPGVANVRGG